MTDDVKQVEEVSLPNKEKVDIKKRRGVYPKISLKKTLELIDTIYKIGQGEPVRRLAVFDDLKKSPDSGSSRMLVTTSSSYGLTEGSYIAEHLKITTVGISLLHASSAQERHQVIYGILFGNDVFSRFVDYWKNKAIPVDAVAADWLVRTLQLSDPDAKSCWTIMKENLIDYGLTKTYSGKQMILDRDAALEELSGGSDNGVKNVNQEMISQSSTPIDYSGSSTYVPTVVNVAERDFTYGKARIVLPKKMTKTERAKLNSIIDGLIDEISED